MAGQPSQFTHRDNYIHNTLNVLYKQCSVMRDVKGSEGVREGRGRREGRDGWWDRGKRKGHQYQYEKEHAETATKGI